MGLRPVSGFLRTLKSVVGTEFPGAEHEESGLTESEGGSQAACAVFPPGRAGLGLDPAFPSGCGRKQRLPLQLSNSASVARGGGQASAGCIDLRRDVSQRHGQGKEIEPSFLSRKASRGCWDPFPLFQAASKWQRIQPHC